MPSYPIEMQIKLIKLCFMIHNYIRFTQLYEDEFYTAYDNEEEDAPVEEEEEEITDDDEVNNWRDSLAQAMWDSYVLYLANRK